MSYILDTPQWTGVVQNVTGFVLNVTGFVLHFNEFFLDMTGFVLYLTRFDDDDNDDESHGMAYMTVLIFSCFLCIVFK